MASQTAAPSQYPAQIVFVATDDQATALTAEAQRRRVSKAHVAREWHDLGRALSTAARDAGVEAGDLLDRAVVLADTIGGADKATTRVQS